MTGRSAYRRRRRRRSKERRVSRENRAAMIAITIVVCVLFILLAVKDYQLNRTIGVNEAKKSELTQEIREEEARTEEIENLREYMQTEDYIREAAKEKLGLVEDDEVIFRKAE